MNFCPLSATALVFLISLTPGQHSAKADPVQNALDDPSLEWQAGDGWQPVEGEEALDKQDALVLETVYDDGPGEVVETIVTGPGLFGLWWRVSQGDDEDDMILEVDGEPHLQRDGDPYAWEPVAVNVPAGSHKIGVRARCDGGVLKALIDRASWIPGGRLPAAVAMGDADGQWLFYGDWRLEAGGFDGNGDEARISLPEGPANARLMRLLEGPARVHYWSKSLGGAVQEGEEAGWQRRTQIVGGRESEAAR
ncbi:MAG: hypothetical protein ACKV19_24095, partial [Verrucomicrobiales bacterium]